MGTILELAERCWQGALGGETIGLLRGTYETEEVAPDVHFLHSFANVSAVRTDAGLVLVDTGMYLFQERTFESIRHMSPDRVEAAIYTHGHVDHAFGMPPFLAEAAERSWQPPRIVGHRNVAARFDRYHRTHGYNACINSRQFSTPEPVSWPDRYEYPTTVYDQDLRLDAGSSHFELHHALGETDDHTWVWWPQRKVLFTGDQFIWVSPNAGNPQKVQRYPEEWAESLRRMARCGAEVLVPGHGVPILGADRVNQALGDTAEWLESLVAQTLERMNAGESLDTIIHEVRPPAHLMDRPYLQPVYDDPEYVVRNIWRLYGGWYDGVPAHLQPAREADIGRELASLVGGAEILARRARELADAGDFRLACHLVDWAAHAAEGGSAVHRTRAAIYRERARDSRALMSRGIFRAAARDSAHTAGDDSDPD